MTSTHEKDINQEKLKIKSMMTQRNVFGSDNNVFVPMNLDLLIINQLNSIWTKCLVRKKEVHEIDRNKG